MRRRFPTATAAVALACLPWLCAPANAATFMFTYSGAPGSNTSASGTITTAGTNPSGSFFTPSTLITGLTGVFNGSAITALLTPGTFYKTTGIFGSPGNDNILYYPTTQVFNGLPTYLDRYGLAFSTASQNVNIFFGLGGYGTVTQTGTGPVTSAVGGNFSVTPLAAVPEPATWAMMTLGFGAVGFAMRRKKVSTRIRFA